MNKHSKNILNCFILIITLFIFITPFFVQGQDTGGDGRDAGGEGRTPVNTEMKIKIDNPFKQDTIRGLIETIVNNILMPIGGVVAVVMIMYAGFLFVTARGEPAKITKAKDALLYAVIGAAILLGAWVISEVIDKTISDLKT